METNLGKMHRYESTVLVLSLFLMSLCDPTSSECTQLAPCVCSLPDGSYYNLTGLADAEPFRDDKHNWTVFFHPCTNVKMPDNMCAKENGVSLCMYNKKNNKTLSGTVEETRMKLSNKGTPVFEIYHNDTKSIVDIVYYTENKTSFTMDNTPPPPDSKQYNFVLLTSYGYKIQPERGLSTGSVLVILFFVCTGIYFISGIIVLKTLRGATGWEMIPNYDFWCKLPALVKEGVVFTFNCCRADSYERI